MKGYTDCDRVIVVVVVALSDEAKPVKHHQNNARAICVFVMQHSKSFEYFFNTYLQIVWSFSFSQSKSFDRKIREIA